MADRLQSLLDHDLGQIEQAYDQRDTVLYALGCGAGAEDLALVWEQRLVALPTIATVLCSPARWLHDPSDLLDGSLAVHASERVELFGPLGVAARVSARPRVTAVHDRGPERGALVVLERMVSDAPSGRVLAKVVSRILFRGDGGIGSTGDAKPVAATLPEDAPDQSLVIPISPRAAAIYRLSGDDNPLHIDPNTAGRAGFPAPILHGLSAYGHIARVVLAARPGVSLRAMDCRFSAPLFPGERMELDLWDRPAGLWFRARVGPRIVIDNGEIDFS